MTGGGPRGGGQALDNRLGLVIRIQHRMQHLVKLFRVDAHDGFLARNELFLDHLHRGAHARGCIHLAVAGLPAIEHTFLNRVLVVLDFAVMVFESVTQCDQLPVHLGHDLLQLMHRLRGANAGDDILTLGIDQELAEHRVLAGCRVAGKADTGGAVVAHIAKHHGLYVDRGAVRHVGSNLEFAAVVDRAFARP